MTNERPIKTPSVLICACGRHCVAPLPVQWTWGANGKALSYIQAYCQKCGKTLQKEVQIDEKPTPAGEAGKIQALESEIASLKAELEKVHAVNGDIYKVNRGLVVELSRAGGALIDAKTVPCGDIETGIRCLIEERDNARKEFDDLKSVTEDCSATVKEVYDVGNLIDTVYHGSDPKEQAQTTDDSLRGETGEDPKP